MGWTTRDKLEESSYGKEYLDKCGSCIYLDIDDDNLRHGNFYCKYNGKVRHVGESACTSEKTSGYGYIIDDRRDYKDLYRNYRPNCWYIIGSIFEVLGLNYNYDITSLIGEFRNEYLETNDKYSEFLNDYDKYGRIIADRIRSSEDRVNICKNLARTYLLEFFDLIKSNRIDEAFELYYGMYNLLKNSFVSFDEINEKNVIKVK